MIGRAASGMWKTTVAWCGTVVPALFRGGCGRVGPAEWQQYHLARRRYRVQPQRPQRQQVDPGEQGERDAGGEHWVGDAGADALGDVEGDRRARR